MTGLTGNTIYEVEASLSGDFADSILRELATAKSAPHAPEAVVSTHADSELSISWVEPSNDGGESITGYTVQWKSGSDSYSTTRQLQTDANTTAVDITGLINGREYKVRVFATNSIGDGPAVEVTGTPSTEPLSAATGLLASACDQSLHLSWRPPTNDGGSPIISYRGPVENRLGHRLRRERSANDAQFSDPLFHSVGVDQWRRVHGQDTSCKHER